MIYLGLIVTSWSIWYGDSYVDLFFFISHFTRFLELSIQINSHVFVSLDILAWTMNIHILSFWQYFMICFPMILNIIDSIKIENGPLWESSFLERKAESPS